MGWMDYDVELWTSLRDEARRGVKKELPAPIVGSDIRRDAISFAETNARAAGIGHLLQFEVKDVRDFRPALRVLTHHGSPGTILCNPPYGGSIGEGKERLHLYATLVG